MTEAKQRPPGQADAMTNKPDHGEHSYRGTGLLADKVAVITGADSGIGRAVAIALPYAATKAAIVNFSAGLAQLLGPRGIRVNSVAPGPIWTPLIPATMPPDHVEQFGSNTPLERPGQPAELAPVYVLLASDEASYMAGARIEVTGGRPVL